MARLIEKAGAQLLRRQRGTDEAVSHIRLVVPAEPSPAEPPPRAVAREVTQPDLFVIGDPMLFLDPKGGAAAGAAPAAARFDGWPLGRSPLEPALGQAALQAQRTPPVLKASFAPAASTAAVGAAQAASQGGAPSMPPAQEPAPLGGRLPRAAVAASEPEPVIEEVLRAWIHPPHSGGEPQPIAQPAATPSLHNGPVTPLQRQPVARAMDIARSTAPAAALPAVMQSRLVELDLAALSTRGFIAQPDQRGVLVDQFRVIKRPLINNAMGRGVSKVPYGNLIMVTSAMPGEGKTYSAINLAMSIAAEVDSTVLLVDADVSKPSVHRNLGIEPGPGLLDVLTGRCAVSDAILRTNIPKLTVMQSGTPQERATEMLSSAAMARLLEEMATRYSDRVIVFDLPPLLPTTEARVVAGHAGQLVLVVSSNLTTEAQLRDAIATVEQVPVKLMVLNRAAPGSHAEHGYGYGYTYSRRVDPSVASAMAADGDEARQNRPGHGPADGEEEAPWGPDRLRDEPPARRPSLLARLWPGRSSRPDAG